MAQKQRSTIIMRLVIRRVLTGFGFRGLCRWKAAIVIQRIYRGFVTRIVLIFARKCQSSIQIFQLIRRVFAHRGVRALRSWKVHTTRKSAVIHMCLTLRKALSRRGFLALYHWKAVVLIQRMHRGSVIRKRILDIRNRDFAYIDNEMERILCADPTNLLPRFDETEFESDWSPSMPISSNDKTNTLTGLSSRPEKIPESLDQNSPLKLSENDTSSGCNNIHEEKITSDWQESQRENKAVLQWKQHMKAKGRQLRSFAHGLRKR